MPPAFQFKPRQRRPKIWQAPPPPPKVERPGPMGKAEFRQLLMSIRLDVYTPIGLHLHAIRVARGLTVTQVAQRTGCCRKLVYLIEGGRCLDLQVSTLWSFCRVLRVHPGTFWTNRTPAAAARVRRAGAKKAVNRSAQCLRKSDRQLQGGADAADLNVLDGRDSAPGLLGQLPLREAALIPTPADLVPEVSG